MRWQRHHFEYHSTIVTILSRQEYFKFAEKSLIESRMKLEAFINKNPAFRNTMKPVKIDYPAPRVVKKMLYASEKTGTGPMAAVAGTFAQAAVAYAVKNGADECIVDNGGDICLFIKEPVKIGLYTGSTETSNLAFLVEPRERPFAICTSSGTVGHSFSFGKASLATVISEDASVADAAATALGNRVRSEKDLRYCFDFLKDIAEVEGAVVVYKDKFALWGSLPEIVRSEIDEEIITFGRFVYEKEQSL